MRLRSGTIPRAMVCLPVERFRVGFELMMYRDVHHRLDWISRQDVSDGCRYRNSDTEDGETMTSELESAASIEGQDSSGSTGPTDSIEGRGTPICHQRRVES